MCYRAAKEGTGQGSGLSSAVDKSVPMTYCAGTGSSKNLSSNVRQRKTNNVDIIAHFESVYTFGKILLP